MSPVAWSLPGWALVLIIIGILALIYGLWLILEPRLLQHTEYTLEPVHPLEETHTTLSVHFFSDYHAGLRRVPMKKIIAALTRTPIDGVLFGGDMSSSHKDKAKGLAEFRTIAERIHQASGHLLYGVRGNHDQSLSAQEAHAAQFHLMQNEAIVLTDRAGFDWVIVGEDDMRIGSPDTVRALHTPYAPWVQAEATRTGQSPEAMTKQLRARIEAVPVGRRIVIGHNPDQILNLSQDHCAFFLSGHFHGGQIRLPFRIEYSLLRQEKLIDEGIYQGLFERHGIRGFISRGVGCVLFPFRFMARPEISTLHFVGPID